MKKLKSLFGLVLAAGMSTSVSAAGLDINSLIAGTKAQYQPKFTALTEDMTSALSYKAVSPAARLGGGLLLVGFDVGAEVSLTELANKDSYLSSLPSGVDSISYLPVPKLHAIVGIPFGIDAGLVYATVPGVDMSYMGGELKYSFVSGNIALPAIAVRGTYTQLQGIDEFKLSTYGWEVGVSKGFGVGIVITPYASGGQVYGNSSSNIEVLGVKAFDDESISQWKYSLGLNLKLALLNLAAEMDQTGDAQTYSMKVGLRF